MCATVVHEVRSARGRAAARDAPWCIALPPPVPIPEDRLLACPLAGAPALWPACVPVPADTDPGCRGVRMLTGPEPPEVTAAAVIPATVARMPAVAPATSATRPDRDSRKRRLPAGLPPAAGSA